MEGWIKLHRKLLNNPTVMKNNLHISLWIYLLLNAAHDDYPFSVGGIAVTLKPGQVVIYPTDLESVFNVSYQSICRALNDFEMSKQVRQKKFPKGRIITVLKWDEYQGDGYKVSTECLQDVYKTPANKKKEERSILLDSYESNCRSPDRRDDFVRIIDAWNAIAWTTDVQRIASDSKRGKMLSARLKEYGVDKVMEAVSRVERSEFLKDQTWFSFDWFVKPSNFVKVLEGNFNKKGESCDNSANFAELQSKWKALKAMWPGSTNGAGEVFWSICTGGARMSAESDVDYIAAFNVAEYLIAEAQKSEGGDLAKWLSQEVTR